MNKIRLTLLTLISLAALPVIAISPREAADAILGRNGDRMLAELSKNAKDAETKSIANAPDPTIEADYLVAPPGEDNRWGLGLSYEFDWFGAYGARRNMGKAMRDANALEAEAIIFAKRAEILEEIWSYLYADSRLALMERMAETTDSVRVVAERASRGGELSRLDFAKIDIEHSKIKSAMAAIRVEKEVTENNLASLNGGRVCSPLLESIDRDWITTPLAPLAEYKEAASRNPEMLKAIAVFNVASKNVSVAKAERLPGFSVGYAHEYEDGIHFNGGNLGVTIPLFASRHKVKAAESARAVAEYEMTVTSDRLESQVESLYNEVQALDNAINTPGEVFRNTNYAEMLLKAYRGGEMSLIDYLTELSWFYEAHLQYIDLLYQRESRAARLSLLIN